MPDSLPAGVASVSDLTAASCPASLFFLEIPFGVAGGGGR